MKAVAVKRMSAQIQSGKMIMSGTAARRDVLVVCLNGAQRDRFGQVFERRGLKAELVEDCRCGIEASLRDDVPMAVIMADGRDHYTGALINALRSRNPKPDVWLIGNPFNLCLSAIVLKHDVAVLPPTTTPDQFERMVFA